MADLSIVIPNLDGRLLLEGCLKGLAASKRNLDVILVDNGSSDGSVELALSLMPSIRTIVNRSNVGFAAACNQGAAAAISNLLLFLNNDVQIDTSALDALLEVLATNPDVGACQPTIVREDGSLYSVGSYFTRTGFLHHVAEQKATIESRTVHERFSLNGACMLVRRVAFDEAGGFDPEYFAYFEETDLCWRMRLSGWQLAHTSSAQVVHGVGKTTMRVFPSDVIDFLAFRNRIWTISKNSSRSARMWILPIHILLCAATSALFLMIGRPRNARAICRGIRAGLTPQRTPVTCTAPRMNELVMKDVTVRMTWSSTVALLRMYMKRW